jgi:hypothetical protein
MQDPPTGTIRLLAKCRIVASGSGWALPEQASLFDPSFGFFSKALTDAHPIGP